MKKILLTVVITICAMFVLFAGISAAVVYSGSYNVAATAPHSKLVAGLLASAMDASVEARAAGLKPPAEALEAKGRSGFPGYRDNCAGCHGAPGVEQSEVGLNLYPPAPFLAKSTSDMSMAEVYWIASNGIGDTGMPAFSPAHKPEELWMIASFVKRMNKMSAKEYETLEQGGGD